MIDHHSVVEWGNDFSKALVAVAERRKDFAGKDVESVECVGRRIMEDVCDRSRGPSRLFERRTKVVWRILRISVRYSLLCRSTW